MNKREDLIEVLEGGTPSCTPFLVYDWNMGRAISAEDVAARMADDRWKKLLDMGLLIRHHCTPVKAIEHGVEFSTEATADGSVIETKKTPVGSIRRVMIGHRYVEEWIKEPEDYKVQQWIVENTELVADYAAVGKAEAVVGDHGVVVLTGHDMWAHRTPLMKLNIDYLGTEQFCLDLALEVPELADLLAAQEKLFLAEQELIAGAPGRYVVWYENLSVDMIGPQRYADLMMPVYEKATAILEAGDKRVMAHYDGTTKMIAGHVANAPFHMIDSLSEPPEGDQMYDACRAAWPDKVLLANINIGLYAEPEEVFRQAVIDKRNRAGKKAFLFEISEDLPGNWEERIPVVLETLRELD
ncbi:MAG: hypothetical protein ABFR33_11620 [Verrucomicrobiota bacterium]